MSGKVLGLCHAQAAFFQPRSCRINALLRVRMFPKVPTLASQWRRSRGNRVRWTLLQDAHLIMWSELCFPHHLPVHMTNQFSLPICCPPIFFTRSASNGA